MKNADLIDQIALLNSNRQICIIGAAIIDLVMQVETIPKVGDDVVITNQNEHLGGCAFNVALGLSRLELSSYNAFPIGTGVWADKIKQLMLKHNIKSELYSKHGDNGWCLALVDNSGERTFLTVEGVENDWNSLLLKQIDVKENAIIYVSGYQLTGTAGKTIVDWLESLPISFNLFIDFGPRISACDTSLFKRILKLKPILSINRQEAEYLGLKLHTENIHSQVEIFAKHWFETYNTELIIRLDKNGAYSYSMEGLSRQDIFPVTIVDSIGAGDAHAAGVIAALSADWSLADAIALGNAVASYVVGQKGADSAPTIKELSLHLQQKPL